MAETSVLRRLVRIAVRCRAVLYLLLLLAGIDILVAAHAARWRAYDPSYYRERLDACRRGDWDIVVVGGSPAMCGFDPDVLAGTRRHDRPLRRVFNFGLPLATTVDVWHAVEHGLTRPPRLLVYGIAATDLNANRVGTQGPRYLMDLRDLARVTRNRPTKAHWSLGRYLDERLTSLWSLYHYRDGIRRWAADRLDATWPGLCPDAATEAHINLHNSAALRSPRGLMPEPPARPESRLDCQKAAGHVPPPIPWLKDYDSRGYLPYLDRLLDWGAGRGVEVVLVNVPFSADIEERAYPKEFAAYRATLTGAARRRGVKMLWPSRAELGLTDAHFTDACHLNADGAVRLSAWVRQRLEGEGGVR